MIRVRFHLGAGPNRNKWQVRGDGWVRYFDPSEVHVRMVGCKLRNQRGAAARIHAGDNKSPCAWVECDSYHTFDYRGEDEACGNWVGFDPKAAPHWRDAFGQDIDGREFNVITSDGRHLFASHW